jgi:hypothetical protein
MIASTTSAIALITSQRQYRPLGLLFRFIEAMLQHSSKQHCNVIMSGLANSPPDAFLRTLPSINIFRYLPVLRSDIDFGGAVSTKNYSVDVGTKLSDRDADCMELVAVPATSSRVMIDRLEYRKYRKADTIFGSEHKKFIDMIVTCDESRRILEILQGASDIIRTNRPYILFQLLGESEGEDISRLLRENSYLIINRFLLPALFVGENVQETLYIPDWLIAVPMERTSESLTQIFPSSRFTEVTTSEDWAKAIVQNLLFEAQTSGVNFKHYNTFGESTVPIGRELPSWGFYPLERHSEGELRWTGPRREAGLILPGLDIPLGRIRLVAAGAASEKNRDNILAMLNGKSARVESNWELGYGIIDITPHRLERKVYPWYELEITCPETRRPSEHDSRLLGISISSVVLSAP